MTPSLWAATPKTGGPYLKRIPTPTWIEESNRNRTADWWDRWWTWLTTTYEGLCSRRWDGTSEGGRVMRRADEAKWMGELIEAAEELLAARDAPPRADIEGAMAAGKAYDAAWERLRLCVEKGPA